jgi:NAD(P)-dependent dehydrogenase (short-subunit alcohol dehydrogenase family)
VSPGHTYFDGGTWQKTELDNPDLFTHAMALNPTGRMGTAEEVAAGVVFLSSPQASRISGTNLVIDGAMTRGIQL